jgi:transcriptional regulator with XRE-family HTH domain
MPKQLPERFGDLGAFIREQRSTARLSLRRLSELAGISNPYLSQIERGLRRPSAEILQQIAKALRISAETLYVQAGILEPGNGQADLARDVLADPFLTEDQKQALIRIYLSFRHENEARQENETETEQLDTERLHSESGRHEPEAGGSDAAAGRHETEAGRRGTDTARRRTKADEVDDGANGGDGVVPTAPGRSRKDVRVTG